MTSASTAQSIATCVAPSGQAAQGRSLDDQFSWWLQTYACNRHVAASRSSGWPGSGIGSNSEHLHGLLSLRLSKSQHGPNAAGHLQRLTTRVLKHQILSSPMSLQLKRCSTDSGNHGEQASKTKTPKTAIRALNPPALSAIRKVDGPSFDGVYRHRGGLQTTEGSTPNTSLLSWLHLMIRLSSKSTGDRRSTCHQHCCQPTEPLSLTEL